MSVWGECLQKGCVCLGVPVRGVCTPPETVNAAGSTHPTGVLIRVKNLVRNVGVQAKLHILAIQIDEWNFIKIKSD